MEATDAEAGVGMSYRSNALGESVGKTSKLLTGGK